MSHKYSELIQAGLDLLPQGIADRLKHVHFFTGTDPLYAGLKSIEDSADGRSYRDTWHCSYPWNQTVEDKHVTIVMPSLIPDYPERVKPALVVHELGHVLDEILGFEHQAIPVTKYAHTNRAEAFAEAFTLWVFPGYGEFYNIKNRIDGAMQALFKELGTGGENDN